MVFINYLRKSTLMFLNSDPIHKESMDDQTRRGVESMLVKTPSASMHALCGTIMECMNWLSRNTSHLSFECTSLGKNLAWESPQLKNIKARVRAATPRKKVVLERSKRR